ncbi:MAG: T9SS type A sorting domain-containing protein [Calditrichales bacterium]|nr:T9SS type A sorting domain-containing protein [Calditrichales bacterium]
MKNLIFFALFFIFLNTYLIAQSEYASVSPISAQSSYNDFADIDVTVTAGAGYYWFVTAVEYVYWQTGGNWENIVQKTYYDDWPYDNQWREWEIINEDIQITDIAYKGNGTFKYKFSVAVNDDDDYKEVTFTVTDVVAPAAPANFAGSWSGNHPQISWSESNAADFKEYVIEKKGINAGWIEYETITNKNTTSFVDATEDKFSIGGYLKGYVYYRMKQKDMTNNTSPLTATESFAVNVLNNVDKAGDDAPVLKVDDFALMDNYPNPFNPTTHISFNLPSAEYVTLEVYDVNGKKVNTLVSEYKEAGNYTVEFNGQSLPSGLYFYKIKAGKFSSIERMLLVK